MSYSQKKSNEKFCNVGDILKFKNSSDDNYHFVRCTNYFKATYMFYMFQIIQDSSSIQYYVNYIRMRRYELDEGEKKETIMRPSSAEVAKLALEHKI